MPDVDTMIGLHPDPASRTALVFATDLPVGNGVALAGALFREGPDGWAFVRDLPKLPERASERVAFRNGVATFSAETFKPGDARCCPAGRHAGRQEGVSHRDAG